MKSLKYPKEKRLAFAKYAELAWASYSTGFNEGMYGIDSKGKIEGLNKQQQDKLPTYYQALTTIAEFNLAKWAENNFNNYDVGFSPKQANEFANRYKIVAFVNDTDISFSATLFQDTHDNEYILAIRGINIFQFNNNCINAITQSVKIFNAKIPAKIYFALLNFYEYKVKPILENTNATLVVTGHSFGGYLAQLFTLTYPQIIKAMFIYNAPGIIPNLASKVLSNYIIRMNDIFEVDVSDFQRLYITQEIKDSLDWHDRERFIIIKRNIQTKDGETLEVKIPEYLRFDTKSKRAFMDKYAGINGVAMFDKGSMQNYAFRLYSRIKNTENGYYLLYNTQTTNTYATMSIYNENIMIEEAGFIDTAEAMLQRLKNSNDVLPQPLQRENIYHIHALNAFEKSEFMSLFSYHIANSEVEVSLDIYPISFKKQGLLNIVNFLTYFVNVESIKSIYQALLIESRISYNNKEDLDKFLTFFQGNLIAESQGVFV
ncbi:hypothetical protein [Helicobacter bilis]|uniref:hypothetical protein n=1 Tax=Helicobacter bilis TaxID=37372 RepID=UPI002A803EE2|nr:hypothetical protein [Helicobacter bilis]MDY4399473.1 hypothetical protein [Helicobacter bilis]